ncbi:hypothetical protein HK096_010864 [Nowakowskiella sp. JEL0078]|nr:hypothetical protein HK096_010864 [Nowakowskiella sp. JEL0078]
MNRLPLHIFRIFPILVYLDTQNPVQITAALTPKPANQQIEIVKTAPDNLAIAVDHPLRLIQTMLQIHGALIALVWSPAVTHIVVSSSSRHIEINLSVQKKEAEDLCWCVGCRSRLFREVWVNSGLKYGEIAMPKIVSQEWVNACVAAGTVVDEYRFVAGGRERRLFND